MHIYIYIYIYILACLNIRYGLSAHDYRECNKGYYGMYMIFRSTFFTIRRLVRVRNFARDFAMKTISTMLQREHPTEFARSARLHSATLSRRKAKCQKRVDREHTKCTFLPLRRLPLIVSFLFRLFPPPSLGHRFSRLTYFPAHGSHHPPRLRAKLF